MAQAGPGSHWRSPPPYQCSFGAHHKRLRFRRHNCCTHRKPPDDRLRSGHFLTSRLNRCRRCSALHSRNRRAGSRALCGAQSLFPAGRTDSCPPPAFSSWAGHSRPCRCYPQTSLWCSNRHKRLIHRSGN